MFKPSIRKKSGKNISLLSPQKFPISFFLACFFLLTIFFASIVSADIISINSGGSGQIVVNPDTYIEGFFTGDVFQCGNGIIDPGEQCDDGNAVSGDGCSSTCQNEAVAPPSGGGGGGGAGGGAEITQNLLVTPSQFNINLIVNTNKQETITVTNLGTSATTVLVSQNNLDNRVLINESSFVLQPGESRIVSVIFVATNETGIFVGTISIGNQQVLVIINVKSQFLLFDSNIIVLNKDYIVVKGEELKTRVTLVPLGDKERLDVTLDYSIRDYTGKIYLTQRETLLIQDRINFDRNFGTGNLPVGKYVVGLELKYPNGVAPSSAHFEVVARAPITFGTIVFWLITLIILIIIIFVIIIIYRRKKKEQEEQQIEQ